MPDKVRVRVTLLPDPIDVDPDEIPVLRSQGLLAPDEPDAPATPMTKTLKKETPA